MGKYRKDVQDKMTVINAVNDVKASYKLKEYATWFCMLKRVHQDVYNLCEPKYKDTKIVDEWYTFSNYLSWATQHNPLGNLAIDKDLIGDNMYGPKSCVCISQNLNNALQLGNQDNGYPMGVRITPNGKFNARVKNYYKEKSKTFVTQEDAAQWYKDEKASYLRSLAHKESNPIIPDLIENFITLNL